MQERRMQLSFAYNEEEIMDRLLLKPSEAAALLGIGRTKIYELIRANQLPHRRVGKSIRVSVAQLRDWAEAPAGSEQIKNAQRARE